MTPEEIAARRAEIDRQAAIDAAVIKQMEAERRARAELLRKAVGKDRRKP